MIAHQKNIGIETGLLRSFPLFGGISDEHMRDVAAAGSLRTALSRTILFDEGDPVDHLFLVVCGIVELFSEHDERRLTISVVRAAQALEACSIHADRHPLSARVLQDSDLLSIPTKLIIHLLSHDAGFGNAFARELTKQSLEIVEGFKNHRMLDSTARIAHWMLERNDQSGGNGRIEIPFGKRILASFLGMTPEQLSRSFATLVSAAVVKVDGRIISIYDPAVLTRIAHREEKLGPLHPLAPPYRAWLDRRQPA
jgi:CRP/FNR family transcriptional activator FtrB